MEYTDAMKNRLKRIEGQVRGIMGMMEREESCKDVVTQLSAVRAAIDRLIVYVIGSNMENCIRNEVEKGQPADQVIREAIELLMKSR
ncbi:MAG: metal-sensitive transcriptional regulator [Alicyclobacillaceae bacterium]|nr:metal-sensitive transcriptional regulator [Alicyclobacillaceae bacterium]